MTIQEITALTACSRSAVQKACVRAGFVRKLIPGSNLSAYDLTDTQVKTLISKYLHYKRGRPRLNPKPKKA
jgi:hypothetical protein